jgi:aminoethylphosphonate catabolism LysR family transcriptional regulator
MSSNAQLRAFHYVACYGGFSQAAREMATSQSTLSVQVKALEAMSGINLLERNSRGVKLTPRGQELFDITSRLFQAEAEALALLKRKHEIDKAGHIRLTADGPLLALPILVGMRQERPNMTFSLVIENSDEVVKHVLEYRADVGITAQLPSDPRLHSAYLLSSSIGLCVARDHPLASRKDVQLRDLEGLPFILREQGSRTRLIFERNLAAAGVAIGLIMQVSSRDAVREAVVKGLGCAIFAEQEISMDPRLKAIPIVDAHIRIDEYVICLSERLHFPLIKLFFGIAKNFSTTPIALCDVNSPEKPAQLDPIMA